MFWINTRLGEKHGLQTQKAQASDPVLLTLPSSGPEQGSHVCAPSVPRQHHGLPAPPHTRLLRPRPFPATHSRLTKICSLLALKLGHCATDFQNPENNKLSEDRLSRKSYTAEGRRSMKIATRLS